MLLKSVLLASILMLGTLSMYFTVPEASSEPEIEKIIFIDRFKPTHFPPSTTDGGACDNTSTNFKKITGGVKWKTFPVTYRIDIDPSFEQSNSLTAAQAKAAIVRAFDTWDDEGHGGDSNGDFFAETTGPANITVSFDPIDGPGGTLGFASLSYSPSSKSIFSVEIHFDSTDSWRNFPLECGPQSDTPNNMEFDIENVAAHEIGHAIGFDHVNGGDDVYNTEYTYVIFEGETHKRTLGDGDRIGIASLYGNGGGSGGDGGSGGKCPPGNPNHPNCQ